MRKSCTRLETYLCYGTDYVGFCSYQSIEMPVCQHRIWWAWCSCINSSEFQAFCLVKYYPSPIIDFYDDGTL